MKTVIAGTDFSRSSMNACKYAALLAQKLNCKLVLFNLFEAPVVHSNMGLYGISYSSERKNSENKTEKKIKELKKVFPKLKISEFVTSGSYKEELKYFIKAHQVEAAVMGLESKTKLSKYIYGSHGVNIAGKLDCPVIIVPEKYKKHKISKVLLAVDNNEKLYKSSLKGFEKFILGTKTKLDLLHVRTEDELIHPVMMDLVFSGKKTPVKTVKAKSFENGIKKQVKELKTDLVAIISKKHSVFYNFFSETNTKKIIFMAKVPVMAIHE